jgi:hypothetical protein
MSSNGQFLKVHNHDVPPAVDTSLLPTAAFQAGLSELLKACDYAHQIRRAAWDFAVEISQLRAAGMTDSDFRWLVCMGYVEHAREITRLEEDGREFRPTGNLSFSKRTCFVLTSLGHSFARSLLDGSIPIAVPPFACEGPTRYAGPDCLPLAGGDPAVEKSGRVPHWNADRRELCWGGHVVKQFASPAVNQETILGAFEEDGWPSRIDDPLPPHPGHDQKHRLHDTIKCLNRGQVNHLLRFRGDGTGEGILWETIE